MLPVPGVNFCRLYDKQRSRILINLVWEAPIRDAMLNGAFSPHDKTRVLLIEDDDDVREILAYFLEKSGCDVMTRPDGCNILESVRSFMPSIIICDSRMPGTSGEDVLRGLAAQADTSDIPFILMSGADPADLQLLGQVDAFFYKPFSPGELIQEIARILARPLAVAA